jgi:type II secretory pathway pseudopilin PulG
MFEILVVIGILILIASFVMPFSLKQSKKNELISITRELESNIFLQQQNAYAGKSGLSHGIYITNTGYWLFEGENYDTSTVKDFFELPGNISISSISQSIIFERNSVKPQSQNIISLSNGINTFKIIINKEGMIDHEM